MRYYYFDDYALMALFDAFARMLMLFIYAIITLYLFFFFFSCALLRDAIFADDLRAPDDDVFHTLSPDARGAPSAIRYEVSMRGEYE